MMFGVIKHTALIKKGECSKLIFATLPQIQE